MSLRKKLKLSEHRELKNLLEHPDSTVMERCNVSNNSTLNSKNVYVSNLLNSIGCRDAIRTALIDEGIDAKAIAHKLKDKLDAKKTVVGINKGMIVDTIELDDNYIQLNTLKIAIDLFADNDKQQTPIDNLSKLKEVDWSKLSTEEIDNIISMTKSIEADYTVLENI